MIGLFATRMIFRVKTACRELVTVVVLSKDPTHVWFVSLSLLLYHLATAHHSTQPRMAVMVATGQTRHHNWDCQGAPDTQDSMQRKLQLPSQKQSDIQSTSVQPTFP